MRYNTPKLLAPGVAVIGKFEPDIFDAAKIGETLIIMTSDLQTYSFGAWEGADWYDFSEAAEVRSPETVHENLKSGKTVNWHRDGHSGHSLDSSYCMAVWSNREQTELKLADETVLRPNPGEVVIIQNSAVLHRTPPELSPDRWFFRRVVQKPDWL